MTKVGFFFLNNDKNLFTVIFYFSLGVCSERIIAFSLVSYYYYF